MGEISFHQVLEAVKAFGVPGIVFILWYFSTKSNEITLRAYRDDFHQAMAKHSQEIAEIRQMYENNFKLVQDYACLATELRNTVVLNTQCWQKALDDINKNQYCPYVRLTKESPGKIT